MRLWALLSLLHEYAQDEVVVISFYACPAIGVATYTAGTGMAVPHFWPRSSHQLWHNSQVSSSVTNISYLILIIDDWKLLPTIDLLASEIHYLNRCSHHYQPSLYSQLSLGMRFN